MVSITVTGATITKGYKGADAIEEIKNGIRFRIAVRDEKGRWIYQTCHIEDPYLLEKVKMMGLRAGLDIDFLASMRAVKIKEDKRTRDLSVFLIRHIEFGRPREVNNLRSQTDMKKKQSVSDTNNLSRFEENKSANYISMLSSSDKSQTDLKSSKEEGFSISSLPGFLGYEVLEGRDEWTDFKT